MAFENKITWSTVIQAALIVGGGLVAFNEVRTQNSLQDVRIEANRTALKESLEAERQVRREGLQELRIRMDADRAEMRAQFDKLNGKIDELFKQGKWGK